MCARANYINLQPRLFGLVARLASPPRERSGNYLCTMLGGVQVYMRPRARRENMKTKTRRRAHPFQFMRDAAAARVNATLWCARYVI